MDFAYYFVNYVIDFIKSFFDSFPDFGLFVFVFFCIALLLAVFKEITGRR